MNRLKPNDVKKGRKFRRMASIMLATLYAPLATMITVTDVSHVQEEESATSYSSDDEGDLCPYYYSMVDGFLAMSRFEGDVIEVTQAVKSPPYKSNYREVKNKLFSDDFYDTLSNPLSDEFYDKVRQPIDDGFYEDLNESFDKISDCVEFMKDFKVDYSITINIEEVYPMNTNVTSIRRKNRSVEAYTYSYDGVTINLQKEDIESTLNSIDMYVGIIADKSQKYEFPPEWIMAIIAEESRGNTYDDNGTCVGLMQLHKSYYSGDLTDPTNNIEQGTKALSEKLSNFNDLYYTLGIHGVGPGNWKSLCSEKGKKAAMDASARCRSNPNFLQKQDAWHDIMLMYYDFEED